MSLETIDLHFYVKAAVGFDCRMLYAIRVLPFLRLQTDYNLELVIACQA